MTQQTGHEIDARRARLFAEAKRIEAELAALEPEPEPPGQPQQSAADVCLELGREHGPHVELPYDPRGNRRRVFRNGKFAVGSPGAGPGGARFGWGGWAPRYHTNRHDHAVVLARWAIGYAKVVRDDAAKYHAMLVRFGHPAVWDRERHGAADPARADVHWTFQARERLTWLQAVGLALDKLIEERLAAWESLGKDPRPSHDRDRENSDRLRAEADAAQAALRDACALVIG